MFNYLKELKDNLNIIESEIENEKDRYRLVDLELKVNELKERLNYFYQQIFENFEEDVISSILGEVVSREKIDIAIKKAADENSKHLLTVIKQGYNPLQEIEDRINEIFKKNPQIEDPKFHKDPLYSQLVYLRRDAIEYKNYIANNKGKTKKFYDCLSNEDKDLLVEKLTQNFKLAINSEEEILKKVKNFAHSIDIFRNRIFPIEEQFNKLTTQNEDEELASFLLENKDDIVRLTSYTNHDVLVSYTTKRCHKVEYLITNDRFSTFSNAARDRHISDIIGNTGLYKNERIYHDKTDFNRFKENMKEVKTTENTKKIIKELLIEMDSLNIIDEKSYAGESANKEYGFIKFLLAREKFINVINTNPPSKTEIEKALEELKSQEAKIYKMYDLIEKTLGDDYKTMPSNVDSIRNPLVPPEFKEKYAIQAKFNSLYIMLTFIKQNNISIDDFVNRPVELSNKAFNDMIEKRTIERRLAGKSKLEALLNLSNPKYNYYTEDPYKYSRSYELLRKTEKDPEMVKDNILGNIAILTDHGNKIRYANLGNEYFNGNIKETLQNIFLAKPDENKNINYLDCYVDKMETQYDPKTGFVDENKLTVVEKIQKDDNIVETFYDALTLLKQYSNEISKNPIEDSALYPDELFEAVYNFAVKILVTCDFTDDKYPDSFFEDLSYIIVDYKRFDFLKDFDFPVNQKRSERIVDLIADKNKSLKNVEKSMYENQKTSDEKFIQEFERINKEIDLLDKRADEIGKKIGKGKTNREIENIALEQHDKFQQLQKLQNKKLDELREDLEKGRITQYYFDKKSEQIKLLENLKEKPAMFLCDDKKYKNFKTYAKEILKNRYKDMSDSQKNEEREKYNLLMNNAKEEKKAFIINSFLVSNSLSSIKSVNPYKVSNIVINNNKAEIELLSLERLNLDNKEQIIVNIDEEKLIDSEFQKDNNDIEKELII